MARVAFSNLIDGLDICGRRIAGPSCFFILCCHELGICGREVKGAAIGIDGFSWKGFGFLISMVELEAEARRDGISDVMQRARGNCSIGGRTASSKEMSAEGQVRRSCMFSLTS